MVLKPGGAVGTTINNPNGFIGFIAPDVVDKPTYTISACRPGFQVNTVEVLNNGTGVLFVSIPLIPTNEIPPEPPQDVEVDAFKVCNRCGEEICTYEFTWFRSSSPDVDKYQVSQNGEIIRTIFADDNECFSFVVESMAEEEEFEFTALTTNNTPSEPVILIVTPALCNCRQKK